MPGTYLAILALSSFMRTATLFLGSGGAPQRTDEVAPISCASIKAAIVALDISETN